MPTKEGKIYAELSQNLERMADGIEMHQGDEDFPPSVKKADLRGSRKKLEDLAQKYEELLTKARNAYDSYSELADKLKKEYAGHKGVIEGFYGKKSQILADFGLAPWKSGGKKGPRAKK